MPNIEDTLSQFAGAKYFSTLDLKAGYHQVTLDESSRDKTAFATESTLYEYLVLPQGPCNSPSTFQHLMNCVLVGIPSNQALALDDILVFGKTFREHLENLELVFKRLREHGLKLSTKKCTLLRDKVQYLGHELTREEIKPAEGLVDAICSLPEPKTIRQVRRLCGLVKYYSRFVKDIAKILAPIYSLLSEKKCNGQRNVERPSRL